MIQKFVLIFKEIISNRFITGVVLLVVVVSIFTAGMFRIAGVNFENYILNKFGLSIPPNTIVIDEKSYINRAGLVKKIPITDRTVSRIRKIDGVDKIYPFIKLKVPVQARIHSLLFQSYRTDAVAFGVPYSFVYRDIKTRRERRLWRRGGSSDTVPVIAPTMFIDVYESFAEMIGLPQLPLDQLLERVTVTLRFGQNSFVSTDTVIEKKVKIVGFSKKINNFALVLPYKTVKKYNRMISRQRLRNEYKKLFITVSDHNAMLHVTNRLKKIAVSVDTNRGLSAEIVQLKNNVVAIIHSVSYLILGLVFVAIAFSTLISAFNRIEYYRILRILGCSKFFITISIFIKYALLGLAGSLLGLLIIEQVAVYIEKFINIKGFDVIFIISSSIREKILMIGTVLPVVSTIPALVVLYTKGLSKD